MSSARIAEAFEDVCRREAIVATVQRHGDVLEFAFADQETAPGSLILHHFGLELVAAGVAPSDVERVPADCTGAELERRVAAITTAVRRIRVLLIEHNSYLSGGLPFVFAGGPDRLRARGLCVYRFPKLAAVDVTAHGAAIRIAFAPGELGAITSSGFYVPTRFRGDFVATVRYELPVWRPGPHTAAVALFAQDEPSLHRYYSQRNSDPATPDAPRVLANLEGALHPGVPVRGSAGWFRLVRRATTVTALHRGADDAAFRELGTVRSAAAPDLVFGCKIWSPGSSSGLVADLHDLVLDGALADEQAPEPALRPDPRGQR